MLLRRFTLALVLAAVPLPAWAQLTTIGGGGTIRQVSALPGSCAVGDVVFMTQAPIGLHQCESLNTWVKLDSAAGTGDVTGPASSVDSEVVLFSGTTGKAIKRASATGLLIMTSGVASAYAGGSCTNQFVRSIGASGALTCEAVGTTDISANAVTLAKLATQADDTILANISGGVATPSAVSISALLDGTVGSAQGTLAYRNASGWVALAPGTNGQYLQTQGAGANPQWASGAGGLNTTDIDTSAELRTIVTDESGTGALIFAGGDIGAATATTLNGLTITSSTGTLTITNGKTLSASNTVTLAGTDGSTVTFGTGGTVTYTANNLSVFAATTSAQLAGVLSDESGSGGGFVRATSPTFTTPALGVATATSVEVADEAFDDTGWNGDLTVPTKNAVRDYLATFLSYTDPNADRILYWRDSDNTVQSVTIGAGLTFSSGTLSAGAASFPAADTTSIVEGSGDNTKEIRFEVDGLTTGTVRVLTVPDADLTIAGIATTQTFTNKTIDAEATGNVITIPMLYQFTPAACQDTTASLAFSVPASGTAPTATCVSGTNVRFAVASFDDDGAERQLQGHFTLPEDWTGDIDLLGKWRSADTSGSVVWQLQTICVADAETSDPSWNTAQAITDAAKGTTLQQNDFSQSAVTATGCAAGEEFYFKFFRDSDHASDNLATVTDGIGQLISLRFRVRRGM